MTSSSGRGPGRQPGKKSWQPPRVDSASEVAPVRVDTGKRVVSLIIDVAAGWFLSMIIAMIPFINSFLPTYIVLIGFLLCRDFLYEGRGIGKNLMGLRVVDLSTGEAPSLLQSVERNIIPLAPFVVAQIISLMLRIVPIPWLNQMVDNLVNIVCMVYCIIVIPLEAYRVHNRADGRRIGDEIADTGVVEAEMDFSNILPRQE